MAPFDIPALTRGVSGLFTANAEGKRAAEDRARDQQRQAMTDLIAKGDFEERIKKGKAARQKREDEVAERKIREAELARDQEAEMAHILSQLSPGNVERLKTEKFDGMATTAQIRALRGAFSRQQRLEDRVPRAPQQTDEEKRQEAIRRAAERLVESGDATSFPSALRMATERAGQMDTEAGRHFETGAGESPLQIQVQQVLGSIATMMRDRLRQTGGSEEDARDIDDKLQEALKHLPNESEEGLQRFLQQLQIKLGISGAGGRF